jgi:hypothetical protein
MHDLRLRELRAEDLSTWPDTRLRFWCHAGPLLLLAALRHRPDLADYPRQKGPPTDADIDAYLYWRAVAEASASMPSWIALYRWLLEHLYPEYTRRSIGIQHACEERVLWIGQLPGSAHLPPLNGEE